MQGEGSEPSVRITLLVFLGIKLLVQFSEGTLQFLQVHTRSEVEAKRGNRYQFLVMENVNIRHRIIHIIGVRINPGIDARNAVCGGWILQEWHKVPVSTQPCHPPWGFRCGVGWNIHIEHLHIQRHLLFEQDTGKTPCKNGRG